MSHVLHRHRFVVLDLETTGLSSRRHHICEIGLVELLRGRVADRLATLVRPPRGIGRDASLVNGITPGMLRDAPRFAEAWQRAERFLGGDVLVIHNARFDLAFLCKHLARLGRPALGNPVVDTLALARSLWGSGGNTLADLVRRLGVEHSRAHRALGDAEATAEVFVRMLPRLEERGVTSLEDLLGVELLVR